jgi:DNA mismatch endonuclease (patch repair protein)
LPDLVFAGRRKVIFVNGCFWHYHDCRAGTHAPAANAEFWEAKRARTKARDRHQLQRLESDGWDVLTVWECQLKDRSALEDQLTRFLDGPHPRDLSAAGRDLSAAGPHLS